MTDITDDEIEQAAWALWDHSRDHADDPPWERADPPFIRENRGAACDALIASRAWLTAHGYEVVQGWQPIETADTLDPVLVSNSADVWIGYRVFGEEQFEWRTNDESYCDLTPTHWRPLPPAP